MHLTAAGYLEPNRFVRRPGSPLHRKYAAHVEFGRRSVKGKKDAEARSQLLVFEELAAGNR